MKPGTHAVAEKVLLSMSGGRKSAIAASILQKQGYNVIGVHFTKKDNPLFPCSRDRTAQVKDIASKMSIDVHMVDISESFQIEVEERFVHDRTAGLSSNPCAVCQGKLCFEPLIQKADQMGIKWIATGHAAQLIKSSESDFIHLYQANDLTMDESQLLMSLDQATLKRLVLPLGTLNQAMLFKLAVQFELAEHDDPDRSMMTAMPCYQEIAEETLDWLKSKIPPELSKKGAIRTTEQEIVGAHDGLYRYRLGQPARDLKIEYEGSNQLVIESFDSKTYEVRIGPKTTLNHQVFILKELSWILPIDTLHYNACSVKIQHRKENLPAKIILFEGGRGRLILEQPISLVNLGETVAIYDNQELLGGGVIESYALLD